MSKFIIQGGQPLSGTIEIKGAKNAALPLIASSILSREKCVFGLVPRISDVLSLLEIMKSLGARVSWQGEDTLSITCDAIDNRELDYDLVRRLRASILLVGPLLARFGEVKIPYPGGCLLGRRPLDAHFRAFEALGARVEERDDHFVVKGHDFSSSRVFLTEASVTATENILMLASSFEGEVVIKNAACEPHVGNLAKSLVIMGAHIEGIGTNTLRVCGTRTPGATRIAVVPDQLEIGSFAAAALATRGEIDLHPVERDLIDPLLLKFDDMGASYTLKGDVLSIYRNDRLSAFHLTTNIWPGFPTDLQAPFAVLATQCQGSSMVHDWMYDGRLFYIDKLITMGANITMCDPHRIIVSGPTQLRGKDIESPDIRAGMAMVIAALCAEGKSVIDRVELVDRGYYQIEERLRSLGARIERV
ncbi:UDP-N-acetylglucosamine 1-carboxyvinyltransferase [Candidatus Wirthbacteria bacterium CG2_30_54_11]|uniref:UDP-N-acetylglucosamine 1-carboxyvinyltransferase n=1 Tax=Candidatus Wirthbacteria bacterium CG2_30_54_11 TaxID=1817892 RepID=A0A1J5IYF3_9BACT|nr:MAG: UDP-N-acetylglucosamine 1-carboxyvinyltransferase [Candidatus Wirthbacteria bacterium CG2_30_54_11]